MHVLEDDGRLMLVLKQKRIIMRLSESSISRLFEPLSLPFQLHGIKLASTTCKVTRRPRTAFRKAREKMVDAPADTYTRC
jgi:hypothetical protein